jgi:hypothetical protein
MSIMRRSFVSVITESDDARLQELERVINARWSAARKLEPKLDSLRAKHGPCPRSEEYNRLVEEQSRLLRETDEPVEEMFGTPAATAAGKMAKLRVLKNCIWPDDWHCSDEDADYEIMLTRKFIYELVGAHGLTI